MTLLGALLVTFAPNALSISQ